MRGRTDVTLNEVVDYWPEDAVAKPRIFGDVDVDLWGGIALETGERLLVKSDKPVMSQVDLSHGDEAMKWSSTDLTYSVVAEVECLQGSWRVEHATTETSDLVVS